MLLKVCSLAVGWVHGELCWQAVHWMDRLVQFYLLDTCTGSIMHMPPSVHTRAIHYMEAN